MLVARQPEDNARVPSVAVPITACTCCDCTLVALIPPATRTITLVISPSLIAELHAFPFFTPSTNARAFPQKTSTRGTIYRLRASKFSTIAPMRQSFLLPNKRCSLRNDFDAAKLTRCSPVKIHLQRD